MIDVQLFNPNSAEFILATRSINLVCNLLGYSGSENFIQTESLRGSDCKDHLLRFAASSMGVVGAYGRWEKSLVPFKTLRRFIPLVYIVRCLDQEHARNLHRKIWTQGAVPLILFVTPTEIFPSIGFEFSYLNWRPAENVVGIASLEKQAEETVSKTLLATFRAKNIGSYVGLRDLILSPEARVDKRLLAALQSLREFLSKSGLTDQQTVNALIGRFLYFYVLHDRRLVSSAWLSRLDAEGLFSTRTKDLTAGCCWRVFDEIDRLLNGTVFPLTTVQRKQIKNSHVQSLRDCLKLGDDFSADGQQFSFIDFDFACLQTETLSAIYEQFIKVEKEAERSSKRDDGVYYTPPYLVDFVIDRVEEVQSLTGAIKVLDGTAGSGVFLVAAYRRILETELHRQKSQQTWDAEKIGSLLTHSIFGIEKNKSACAVCAFGLYLTMLDYLNPEDVTDLAPDFRIP